MNKRFTNIVEVFENVFNSMIGHKVTIKGAIEEWNGENFTYKDVVGKLESVSSWMSSLGSRNFYFTIDGTKYDVTCKEFVFD